MTSERRLDRKAALWLAGAMMVVWLCTISGCGTTKGGQRERTYDGERALASNAGAVWPVVARGAREDAVEVRFDGGGLPERGTGREADVRGMSIADPLRGGRALWDASRFDPLAKSRMQPVVGVTSSPGVI